MNNEQLLLLDKIGTLAGPLREKTFLAAAQFILENNCNRIIETGCFRGIPDDGQSTLIFALLARELDGKFASIDNNIAHVETARRMLSDERFDNPRHVTVRHRDSVLSLAIDYSLVRFVYLDSCDHDPANPGPCQRHELAEIGAILGHMAAPCAILLDDCIPETGGKTLLGAQFLTERGWKLAAQGYQLLFTLEQ